jgi:spore germination cell wall hydrolase CwlJ-like protein
MNVLRVVAALAFGACVAELVKQVWQGAVPALPQPGAPLPQPLFTGAPMTGQPIVSAPMSTPAARAASSSHEVDVLARTVWGEARGESDAGKIGVASVIRNRVRSPGFPKTYADVCLQKEPGNSSVYEFSAWDVSGPNRAKMLSVTSADPVFVRCLQIAAGVMGGSIADNTGGATFYHDTSIGSGGFFSRLEKTVQIGRLIFFREGTGIA